MGAPFSLPFPREVSLFFMPLIITHIRVALLEGAPLPQGRGRGRSHNRIFLPCNFDIPTKKMGNFSQSDSLPILIQLVKYVFTFEDIIK